MFYGLNREFCRLQNIYPVTIVIENCGLKKGIHAKKTLTGPGLTLGVKLINQMVIFYNPIYSSLPGVPIIVKGAVLSYLECDGKNCVAK